MVPTNFLKGSCKSIFFYIPVEKSFIENLLPGKLSLDLPKELGKEMNISEDMHPVLIMANVTHLEFDENFLKNPVFRGWPFVLDYDEYVINIPYVRRKDHNLPYIFLPVLYLDSWRAILGARLIYQFNKRKKSFEKNKNYFRAKNIFGRSKMETNVVSETLPAVKASSSQHFMSQRSILYLTVVQHGIYGYSQSIYQLEDLDNALITPAKIKFVNKTSFLPEKSWDVRDINDSPMGAYRINYNWKLTFPFRI